ATGNYGTYRVESPANQPPGRYSYTRWKDAAGNFYIFAGITRNITSHLNDVWRYRPSVNQWTLISRKDVPHDPRGYPPQMCKFYDNYMPPARYENQTAFSINNCAKAFWTFGGFDYQVSTQKLTTYNDLWLFEVDSFKWAWVGGTSQPNHMGVFGTMGVPAA